jgi:hypothetical protein
MAEEIIKGRSIGKNLTDLSIPTINETEEIIKPVRGIRGWYFGSQGKHFI